MGIVFKVNSVDQMCDLMCSDQVSDKREEMATTDYRLKVMGLCYNAEENIMDRFGEDGLDRKTYRIRAKQFLLKLAKEEGIRICKEDIPDLIKAMEENHFDI